ncbi:MAG TPA: response regulator [Kofleriaceae bacterium]
MEAGKLQLTAAQFNVRAVVYETLRALAMRAHRKKLELVGDIADDVPDAVVGDAARFRQILTNLVGNAIKFTERGEVLVEVTRVCEGTDSTTLRIQVRDTGVGIAPDVQSRIFEAFEQADTSTTKRHGGTGLGLSIAARLVSLMSGTLSVDSEPGVGSQFTFTVRFESGTPQPRAAAPSVLTGLRVLVVDDNDAAGAMVARWLRGWGADPVFVRDASAALRELSSGPAFGAVLIDALVADSSGVDLASRIRCEPRYESVPLILLGHGERPRQLADFLDAGGNGHTLKPLIPEELQEAISTSLAPTLDSPANPGASTLSSRRLRVLVAEDDELNELLMRSLFVRAGHEVRVARDGREAVALAASNEFDAMLLDLHLPEMDGFEVVDAIRARERATSAPRLPVIATTARLQQDVRSACFAAGMDGFLGKPLSLSRLRAALAEVTATTRTRNLVDPETLLASCGHDAALLESLLAALAVGLPAQLNALAGAAELGDMRLLKETAHRVTGIAAVFSTAIRDVGIELEDAATNNGRAGDIRASIERLSEMSEVLIRETRGLTVEALRARVV